MTEITHEPSGYAVIIISVYGRKYSHLKPFITTGKCSIPDYIQAMLGIFRKNKIRSTTYPREERMAINGDVYVKRTGLPTLRSSKGNINEDGLYLQIPEHGLRRGIKVEIVLVIKNDSLLRISRLMGIIIRTDEQGVAIVTYKKGNMNSRKNLLTEEQLLKQEFGKV